MATNENANAENALSKKVKCASFDISIYPYLNDLASFVSKQAAASLSATAKDNILPGALRAGMQDPASALGERPEGCVYYSFGERQGEPGALVSLAPSFVAGLSEAYLGSGFNVDDAKTEVTDLDSELVQLFAIGLADNINSFLTSVLAGRDAVRLAYLGASLSREKTLKSLKAGAFFSIMIGFKAGEDNLDAPLAIHFPVDFLEGKNLLAAVSKSAGGEGDNTQWYADLVRNVFVSEIDLPVVIARYQLSLNDLSKLEVGQLIPLEENAHEAMDVTLKTNEKTMTLGKGRLGVFKKNKAVKLVTDLSAA